MNKQKRLFIYQKENRNKLTESEKCISNLLDALKIKYISQKGFISGEYFYLIDFYLPKPYKICIEVDGEYHETEEQKIKDKYKDKYLLSRNFKILRIKNKEAMELDAHAMKKAIDNIYNSAGAGFDRLAQMPKPKYYKNRFRTFR